MHKINQANWLIKKKTNMLKTKEKENNVKQVCDVS